MGLAGAADYTVPIETSRGCWWGERQHCIFCALNGLDMKHRSKSPERALAEIEAQARHRRPFFATDNILPLEFFHGLFERLLASGVPYPAFYETKSNLSLGQLKTLRQVGLWGLQPGIESLSTPILRHMKKGVGAAQNLWILRAAEELGFGVAWSILYGFPQEEPAEYEQMADLLPSLSHLSPPLRPAPVLLERHSPLFEESASYGLRNVRPTTANRAAFGDVPGLGEQAHVFDFEYPDGREPDRYTRRLNQNVLAWRTARRRLGSPRCEVFRVGSLRFVLDSRDASSAGRGRPRLFLLSDAEWELATLTEEITTESKLREKWSDRAPLEPVLRAFLDRRWLVPIDGRLVRVLLVREKPTVAAEVRRAMESGLHRADRALRRVRARLASVGLGS
jgi:ribosomal peptide maturation radical SAM protein 1